MDTLTSNVFYTALNTIESTLDGLTAICLLSGPDATIYEVVDDCTADLTKLSKMIHNVLDTIAYEEMNEMYTMSSIDSNQPAHDFLKNS